MTIGIDIDDTITRTTYNANEYLKKYDPNFKEDYHKLPKERYEEFLTLYNREIMRTNPLMNKVKEAFQFFRAGGIKIVIITYRPNTYVPDPDEITENFLKENGLEYDILINTYDKGIAASENGVDLYIDDKEVHLDDVNSFGIECIRFTEQTESKYRTFSNWDDIIEYVKAKGVTDGRENNNSRGIRH